MLYQQKICNISHTHHNVTSYTNCLSCFRMVSLLSVKFYICQHKICSECSVFWLPEYVKLGELCSGLAVQWKINHLIFCSTLSNQCCRPSYNPQWRRIHCAGYDKARFTPVTYIPVLTTRSWLEHRNRTVYFLYYSATDVES